MPNNPTCVITTIQQPTSAVSGLLSKISEMDSSLIVIGDKKGPEYYDLRNVNFLSLADQLDSQYNLARELPTGHYARKNVGYLEAIQCGATSIYETDDDNAPLSNWAPRQELVHAHRIERSGWINVFRLFSDQNVWPRGFPLERIRESSQVGIMSQNAVQVRGPIQQGLANNSPDVDAIWRLILDKELLFECRPSVYLPKGTWCPFNSQSTWWFPTAYPLMYLPSYCSFRMTDIWRSFIAQRCLWEIGCGLVFHGPEVVQERNSHNLLRDFADEIPGYTRNGELIQILETLTLEQGTEAIPANMLTCYDALSDANFFPREEIDLVRLWLDDLERVTAAHAEQ